MPPLKEEVPAARAVGFKPRRIRELESMVPEFVSEPTGSKCQSALPDPFMWHFLSLFEPHRILRL